MCVITYPSWPTWYDPWRPWWYAPQPPVVYVPVPVPTPPVIVLGELPCKPKPNGRLTKSRSDRW